MTSVSEHVYEGLKEVHLVAFLPEELEALTKWTTALRSQIVECKAGESDVGGNSTEAPTESGAAESTNGDAATVDSRDSYIPVAQPESPEVGDPIVAKLAACDPAADGEAESMPFSPVSHQTHVARSPVRLARNRASSTTGARARAGVGTSAGVSSPATRPAGACSLEGGPSGDGRFATRSHARSPLCTSSGRTIVRSHASSGQGTLDDGSFDIPPISGAASYRPSSSTASPPISVRGSCGGVLAGDSLEGESFVESVARSAAAPFRHASSNASPPSTARGSVGGAGTVNEISSVVGFNVGAFGDVPRFGSSGAACSQAGAASIPPPPCGRGDAGARPLCVNFAAFGDAMTQVKTGGGGAKPVGGPLIPSACHSGNRSAVGTSPGPARRRPGNGNCMSPLPQHIHFGTSVTCHGAITPTPSLPNRTRSVAGPGCSSPLPVGCAHAQAGTGLTAAPSRNSAHAGVSSVKSPFVSRACTPTSSMLPDASIRRRSAVSPGHFQRPQTHR